MFITLKKRFGKTFEIIDDELENWLVALLLWRLENKLMRLEKAKKRKQEKISKANEKCAWLQREYDSYLDAYRTLKNQYGIDGFIR
ncbi:MAG: hypothetical protein ACXWJZ_02765 [Burkholderiaceae bacterium]